MTEAWIGVIAFLAICLGLAGFEIKHEISKNSELTTSLEISTKAFEEYKTKSAASNAIGVEYEETKKQLALAQDQLQHNLGNSTQRLYINAKCPMPKPDTSSLPDGQERVELNPETARSLASITADCDTTAKQLTALQDFVRML